MLTINEIFHSIQGEIHPLGASVSVFVRLTGVGSSLLLERHAVRIHRGEAR